MRVGLSLYGWLQLKVQPQRFDAGEWPELIPRRTSPTYPWVGPWEHWDAIWYKHIALFGYHAGDNSVHFAPLLPALSRLLMPLYRGSFGLAALTVSTFFAIVAFALLPRLAALDGSPEAGSRAALYMCAYPVGFFLFTPFTEATFLALSVMCFLCARRGWWWWAGLFGTLTTATHFQGVLLSPALMIEYWQQMREGRRKLAVPAINTLFPGLALLVFAAYSYVIVGEHRSLITVDKHWGTVLRPPWQVLQLSWQSLPGRDAAEALNFAVVIGVAVAAVVGLKYLRFSYVVYLAAQLAPPLIHTSYISPLESAGRYLLVAFPAFLLLGRAGRRPWLHVSILVIFFILQGLWLWQFVVGNWVA